MRKFLFVILSALVCGLLIAAPPNGLTNRNLARIAASVPPAGGGDLLIDLNFEETGAPPGVTLGGTADPDNASSPLADAQDLLAPNGSEAYANAAFTPSDEVWVTFTFKTDNRSSTGAFFYITTTGLHYVGVTIGSTEGLQFDERTVGLIGSQTADQIPNAQIFVFVHVAKGTGNDAVYDLEWNTTNTRVGSGSKFTSVSSGIDTLQWSGIQPYRGALNSVVQWDNVKVSNTGWPP